MSHDHHRAADDALHAFLRSVRGHSQDIEVDVSDLSRRQFAYDASNYRVLPAAVTSPRTDREVAAVLAAAALVGLPVVPRGSGTSMAGNAIGHGVVLDLSRHMNRVLEVRPEERLAVVQAGTRLVDLQREAAQHGLMFAPDPSSGSRVTVGGMIGNDACGNHSVAYGRTSDHVVALRGLLADGTRFEAGAGVLAVDGEPVGPSLADRLREAVARRLAPIRTELGRIPRQVSGYALHRLLPENGFDVPKLIVGSEGTLAVVTTATVRLVPRPTRTVMIVVGYPDLDVAADDVPVILQHGPAAIEAMDHQIVAAVADRRLRDALGTLPAGRSWFYVELTDGESFISPSGVDVHPDRDLE